MIVKYNGETYEYPDSTDIKSFPAGAQVVRYQEGPYTPAPGPKPFSEKINPALGSAMDALTGAIHGAATGPITGRVFKAIAPEQYANMQNETRVSAQRSPTATAGGEIAGGFASPESIALGRAGGALSSKVKQAAHAKALDKISEGLGIDAVLEGPTPEMLEAAKGLVSPRAALKAIKPAVGAYAGYKTGETVEHPYLGAILGTALAGGKPGLGGMHHALVDPVMSPAVRYQLARTIPGAFRTAGALAPGPTE